MNYIVVNSVCCCLNLCCKQIWQSLYKIIGKSSFIKFAYILVYFGAVVTSIGLISILNNSWSWFMETFAPGIDCKSGTASLYLNCLSASVAYRISFCLFILSILMLMIMLMCSARVALIFNEGLFFSKFVIVMALFLVTLRMSNQFFMVYGDFSEVISYFFVAAQAIILIDLSYLWGIRWAKKYSQGSQKYAVLLIAGSALMFAGTLAFIITSFSAHHDTLTWADILCTIQVVTMLGVQLLNFNKQNSLLTTSSICLLVSYLTWNAGFSHPISGGSKIPSQTLLYINLSIMVILLVISTAGSIYGSSNKEEDENRFIDLDNINAGPQQLEMHDQEKSKWVKWILYLVGFSTYVCMLVTDWGSADLVEKEFNLTTGAWFSKFFMSTIIFAFYTWTLLAPRLCPNRNFYFQ